MRWFMAILAACAVAPAWAEMVPPDVLVRNVTGEVLEVVRKDKDIQGGNARKAAELVEAKVLPHFNFDRMTSLAVGKDWRQASPAQRSVLVDEFRTLLVRTYSKALTEFRNQTIEYKPFKMAPGATEVTVRTQVNQTGAKPVQLDYNLQQTEQGWKVFDIAVGGVSLVTNYRGEFGQQVSAGGIDGLIKSLQKKNGGGGATTPAAAKQ